MRVCDARGNHEPPRPARHLFKERWGDLTADAEIQLDRRGVFVEHGGEMENGDGLPETPGAIAAGERRRAAHEGKGTPLTGASAMSTRNDMVGPLFMRVGLAHIFAQKATLARNGSRTHAL